MTQLIVETKQFGFDALRLESGAVLGPINLAYETYGEQNADKTNAILIFHALSGDAHLAGKHSPADKKQGWWDEMVGPDKAFDTNKYFVICVNTLGGCQGSTGPSSIDPKTNKPYGMDFPLITIKDMVNAQVKILDHLGIGSVLAAVGGSMGGMLALQFAVACPNRVRNVIPIATSAKTSAQNIAFNEVGRQAIMHDANWKQGNYYDGEPPNEGLSIARMIGHITYLSDQSMSHRFGRKIRGSSAAQKIGGPQFEVESYLQYKGLTFSERFDANTYLYLSKAMDLFDLAADGGGDLGKALEATKSRFLVIYFTSDWLFPEYQSLEIVDALKNNFANVSYRVIESTYGHDAFLLETEELTKAVRNFLKGAR